MFSTGSAWWERRFQERLQQYGEGIPEEAQRVIDEELAKLGSLEPSSSEFNVTRNYLDWLSSIPWGVASAERLDIGHAQQVGPGVKLPVTQAKDAQSMPFSFCAPAVAEADAARQS